METFQKEILPSISHINSPEICSYFNITYNNSSRRWYFYIASEKQISDNLALGDAIQPGIPKATLILAGNDKQSLTPTYPTPVKVNHSTTAIAQNGALIYPSTPNINIDIPQKQQPETVEKTH